MKILISSHVFFPNIGGLEQISATLASEFQRQDHNVKLITQTTPSDTTRLPFEVIRRPAPKALLNLVSWCDVYWQNNISLQAAWPLFFIHRPWFVTHQTWIPQGSGIRNWRGSLKYFLLRYATGISISQAIADHISTPSVIVPNPYDDSIFCETPDVPRDKELIFVGRLVHDKGLHILLKAVEALKAKGLAPFLTIVGPGNIQQYQDEAKKLGIANQICFVGPKRGKDLVLLMNRHTIMVVPSLWREPFGIVALEGIACGCVVVGSKGGGLKDAIGQCGPTFPNGDVESLTEILFDLFSNTDKMEAYRIAAKDHLAHHTIATVADVYLKTFKSACEEGQ